MVMICDFRRFSKYLVIRFIQHLCFKSNNIISSLVYGWTEIIFQCSIINKQKTYRNTISATFQRVIFSTDAQFKPSFSTMRRRVWRPTVDVGIRFSCSRGWVSFPDLASSNLVLFTRVEYSPISLCIARAIRQIASAASETVLSVWNYGEFYFKLFLRNKTKRIYYYTGITFVR
jgi:hypothetical protein